MAIEKQSAVHSIKLLVETGHVEVTIQTLIVDRGQAIAPPTLWSGVIDPGDEARARELLPASYVDGLAAFWAAAG
jgi:hypothetical protein